MPKYIRTCSQCGDVAYVTYKPKGDACCYLCRNKRKIGQPAKNKGKQHIPRLVGNIYIDTDGYLQTWIGEHTCVTKSGGYYLVHRIIVELVLKRLLTFDEVVHHIDGNKLNNRSSNLMVLTKSSHRKVHKQLEDISFELFGLGIIYFSEGTYKIAPHVSNNVSAGDELSESLSDFISYDNADPSKDIVFEGATTIQQWSRLLEQPKRPPSL